MPEIPDVIPGAPVESSWGNTVRDRSAQRYADQAALDLSVPVPVVGDLAYLTGAGTFQHFDGSAWVPLFDVTASSPITGASITHRGDAQKNFLWQNAAGDNEWLMRVSGGGSFWSLFNYTENDDLVNVTQTKLLFTPGGNSFTVAFGQTATSGLLVDQPGVANRFAIDAVGGGRTWTFERMDLQAPPGTASAANAHLVIVDGSAYRFHLVTSATEYKTGIADLAGGLDLIRGLRPVTFDSVHEADVGKRFAGFLAEDVAAVIPEAEQPDDYDVQAIVAALVSAVQELDVRTAGDG